MIGTAALLLTVLDIGTLAASRLPAAVKAARETRDELEKMLRDELHGDLAQLIRIAAEGDDESVLSVGRQDVPRLVRVLWERTEQHAPQPNGGKRSH